MDQTIHEALRFKQQVATSRFDVKMLRDVTTSARGRFVAYTALGKLYLKELPFESPDGSPETTVSSSPRLLAGRTVDRLRDMD